jgi:predicted ATPase
MIQSFQIGNFKAFGETQEIPLKPITLIFGPQQQRQVEHPPQPASDA